MTRLFRNVLCPVDFSKHSQHALQYAALLASRAGARLTALFVEDPFLAAAAAGTTLPATTRAELRRFVERSAAPFGVGPGSIVVHVTSGKPHMEIARIAARLKSDLIVMGAHGVTGPAKMMLGSTTERVLRNAKIPVLAIPAFKPRSMFSRSWPSKLTLVPVALGSHLRHDAAAAAEIAEQLGTHIVLLHVVPPKNRSRLLAARTRLDRLIGSLKPGTAVSCRVMAGKPDEQIAAMAEDAGVDLVILTRRRGQGLFGARIGSISYQVLCDAGTPVLALPATSTWRRRTGRASLNGTRRAG